MPPDPEEIRAWLDRARIDLDVAELLAGREDRLLETVGFHAQQCAEKALKAVLVSRLVRVEKVHNLRYLAELCADHDPSFAAFANELSDLTAFAVAQRYPGARTPKRPEVSRLVAVARRVLEHVERTLSEG